MSRKNPVLKQTAPMLEEKYGTALCEKIMAEAEKTYQKLCQDHSGDRKAVKTHTEGMIYPCISLYDGMQKAGIPRKEAAAFLDWAYSKQAEPKAASIRMMMKLPGMYRLMPSIFKLVTKKQFGTEAGFTATFYDTEKTRVKFDMTKCLYCDVCRREGCPELVPCFCHTDDVTDGNMHPRLCWNRTKIMGDGADVCDFDLFVTDKK